VISVEQELVPYECSRLPPGPYLIFAPHPDDETFGMGGTIAHAAADGINVAVAFVTDGSGDGNPQERKREAQKAAEILGISRLFFLNVRDRNAWAEREHICKEAERLLDELRPKTVFSPSLFEYHPDHRATTVAVWQSIKDAGWEGSVWLYEIGHQGEINRLISIDTYIDRKVEAIRMYSSQLAKNHYEEVVLSINKARTFTLRNSRFAEGFFALESHESIFKVLEHRKLYLKGLLSLWKRLVKRV